MKIIEVIIGLLVTVVLDILFIWCGMRIIEYGFSIDIGNPMTISIGIYILMISFSAIIGRKVEK